jgi:hypothetical protein
MKLYIEVNLTKDDIYQILTFNEDIGELVDEIGQGFETIQEALQQIDEIIEIEKPNFVTIKINK